MREERDKLRKELLSKLQMIAKLGEPLTEKHGLERGLKIQLFHEDMGQPLAEEID